MDHRKCKYFTDEECLAPELYGSAYTDAVAFLTRDDCMVCLLVQLKRRLYNGENLG